MDLCLPQDWAARPGGVFRDDLGPQIANGQKTGTRPAFVCGLRNWRVEAPCGTRPVARSYSATWKVSTALRPIAGSSSTEVR